MIGWPPAAWLRPPAEQMHSRQPPHAASSVWLLYLLYRRHWLEARLGKNPRRPSQAALLVRVYYLCNLNPINSKPTQSSSARRGQRRRKKCVCVCVCVWDEMKQQERNESRHLSFRFIVNFLAPFCDIQQWLCSLLKAARLTFISSIPRRSQNGEKENPPPPLLLFNLTFHSGRVTGGGRESLLALCLWKWKQRHVCMQVLSFFFLSRSVSLSSVDTRTWPSHTEDIE